MLYTNPWGEHEYVSDIEHREDGGTPPILQAIKAALCIRLKEEMGVGRILEREEEIVQTVFDRFAAIGGVEVLASDCKERLGIFSFIVKGAHHNLVVKMLNDRFGIQARGGCSCAGTYGHILLHIDVGASHEIWRSLRAGDMLSKPGWVRLSFHPTMSQTEIDYIMDAVEITVGQYEGWKKDYVYDPRRNEYVFDAGRRCDADSLAKDKDCLLIPQG
jgi:selenocysteine lyase/cysteine desulfurase